MKTGFLGGGNMAAAIIGGMAAKGMPTDKVHVVDLQPENCARLAQQYGVTTATSVDERLIDTDLIVLAVKPQSMKTALQGLHGKLTQQLVLSIAAGLRIRDLARWLGGYQRIVRCMPNTPALVSSGVSGLFADPSVEQGGRDAAEELMQSVGSVVWVDSEAGIDGVTAVSGSGPAYVFHFIEALEAGGKRMGFDEATARRLAIDTVLGAARLAASSDEAPSVLRERVTSKGGTTAAALACMAESGVFDAIVHAIGAAEARARELGDELGKQ